MAFERRMRALPPSQIEIRDAFWNERLETLLSVTLPAIYRQCEETGRFENFRRAAAGAGDFQGLYFNDSDVYKYLEACAYALARREDAAVRSQMEEAIRLVEAAQEPDGYLNTFFQLRHPNLKWRNLHAMHEMYCGGHLVEAAVALKSHLDDDRLLAVAERWIAHVRSVFGPDRRAGFCGHQELELALYRLADLTGKREYAEFAAWQLEQRGHSPSPLASEYADVESFSISPYDSEAHRQRMLERYDGEYCQDHLPLREQTTVVGHAVRAMYFLTAAAHLADGRNDAPLEAAIERLWRNLVERRMYVTGGIGPSAHNEGFTKDFDLPNRTSYAETCAAIGLALFGQTLLEQTANGDYADVVERAIYNGALSGISLSGDRFFYANPLESLGDHDRPDWYVCACCPPNIARLIGRIGDFAYGIAEDGLYVHFPLAARLRANFAGQPVTLEITGNYPHEGRYVVTVRTDRPVAFALRLRIPDWADEVGMDLPGSEDPADYEDGYAVFERTWKDGDQVTVDLEMTPRLLATDPRVSDNLGRVAVQRGPLVYCAEAADNPARPQLATLDPAAEPIETPHPQLQGLVTVTLPCRWDREEDLGALYAPLGTWETDPGEIRLIPYFAWNNRGANPMAVWLRSC